MDDKRIPALNNQTNTLTVVLKHYLTEIYLNHLKDGFCVKLYSLGGWMTANMKILGWWRAVAQIDRQYLSA